MLGEDQSAISDDIEDAVNASDEFGLHPELRGDLGRQTGGPRQIVSTYAVGYGDAHRGPCSSPPSMRVDDRNTPGSGGIVRRRMHAFKRVKVLRRILQIRPHPLILEEGVDAHAAAALGLH